MFVPNKANKETTKGKAAEKRYYLAHKAEFAKRAVEYRATHKEEMAAQQAEYYAANKEEINRKHAEYDKAHAIEIAARRAKHYREHREERLRKGAEYKAAHKEERAEYNAGYAATHQQELVAYRAQYKLTHRAELAWNAMCARCSNPTKRSITYVGVKVCWRWAKENPEGRANFVSDMGQPPEDTSLGRSCDMGDYEPGQTFWMTSAEQVLAQKNKRALLKWAAAQENNNGFYQGPKGPTESSLAA
jgi:hypothetical protein